MVLGDTEHDPYGAARYVRWAAGGHPSVEL